MAQQILLAVLAHPDDETFAMGGTLALYAQRGAAVHLVCATRGEAGDADEQYLRGYQSIAELREAELTCAAHQLGLSGVHFLNYRDSGMPGAKDNQHPQALINIPMDELVGKIVSKIRELHPQVVLTHDPMGGYGHPDHIYLQRAVEQAFRAAGDLESYPQSLPSYTPQKLYYHTIPRTGLRWMVRWMILTGKDPRKFGNNGDIDMKAIAEVNFPTNAKINYSAVVKTRLAASNCYSSQGGQKTNQGVAALLRGWASSYEIFMRAYPIPRPRYIEKDLFEGVNF
jgi:LmbE family N-acetylglucosaminyl deacetylase